MRNIQGKIKFDVFNDLFEMGSVRHPDEITKEITEAMVKYNNTQPKYVSIRKVGWFGIPYNSKEEYKPFNHPESFIKAIRSHKIGNVSKHFDNNYFVDLWYKIQDLRIVLEVKCVAKNCQSNNMFADRDTLLTLDRVVKNKKEYLEL